MYKPNSRPKRVATELSGGNIPHWMVWIVSDADGLAPRILGQLPKVGMSECYRRSALQSVGLVCLST